jgi:hypothetical protein
MGVMNATGQLLNIKEKEIDNQVLGLLVQEGIHRLEAIESVTGGEGAGKKNESSEVYSARKYCERLEQLLKAVSTSIVEDPKFWQV